MQLEAEAARRALGEYAVGLLHRSLPLGPLAQHILAFLSRPGFVLSERADSGLPFALLHCYDMLSSDSWERALPAATALELTNSAIELFDKFLDDEGLEDERSRLHPIELNVASCLQALSHAAIADLEKWGFPASKVTAAHQALVGIVLETNAAQDQDLRAEGHWLTMEESLALAIGKGAPLGGGVGALAADLASDDPAVVETCVEFTRLVGAYHQSTNDLNDAMPGATHKSDVRRRKSTLPLVYFVSLSDQAYATPRELLRGPAALSLEDERTIREALVTSGALHFAAVIADSYRLQARNVLRALEPTFPTAALLRATLAWP